MNVIFHVTTAIGLAVALTDTTRIRDAKDTIIPAVSAFVSGIFIHGVIDYLPHTYPFSAKLDIIISFLFIVIILVIVKKKYLSIMGLAFWGCILPDIIDLLPPMINKYLGFQLTVNDKIFPWHTHEYSGSIFIGTSIASDINHIAVVLITAMVCWCRRNDFMSFF